LHDSLTELPNWTLFQERLRHSLAVAKRNTTQHACMFVELKGLQLAPDDLGRNSLIKAVANRLKHTKRDVDTLARFSDNMFTFLLENVSNKSQLDLIVKRISGVLSTPFEIKGQEILIETNINVSICTDACGAAENPSTANIKQCYECVRTSKMAFNSEVIL
jgi:two-component system CheB/CheR fusion protein